MKAELKAIKLPKKKDASKQLVLVAVVSAILAALIYGIDGLGMAIIGFLSNL